MPGARTTGTGRPDRAAETREAILAAAERLFAEHGVFAVSNRQVGQAAGQGNTAAVGYHFGTKDDLVRAIARKHGERVERIRERMLAAAADSADLRDWVACLVRPTTEHLASLGRPTWYARFIAQVMTDPPLRDLMIDASLDSPTLRRVIDGFNRCVPDLPLPVRIERGEMARHLIVHTCADRERALAEGVPTPRATWEATATGLIDAITGLWRAPVTGDDHERKQR